MWGLVMLWALSACGPAVEAPLVDPLDWTYVPLDEDPFFAGGEEPAPCDQAGLLVEFGIYEIDTGLCPWATVSQPTFFKALAGEEVRIVAYHTPLLADLEGAEATMEVRLGEELLWTQTSPIPSPDQIFVERVLLREDHPRGELLLWHVHNHGQNGYRLPTVALTSDRREVRRAVE